MFVHDLSTGERRVYDGIGQTLDARQRRRFDYLVHPSAAVHWAQDASAVLMSVRQRHARNGEGPTVLDLVSGALTPVAGDEAAGFRSPTEVVTVSKVDDRDTEGGILVTATDLASGAAQSMPLHLTTPWRGDPDSDLGAVLSPDGSRLLLVEVAEGAYPEATLRIFSMVDGRESAAREVDNWDGGCLPTWFGGDPVVPTKSQVAGSVLVTANESRPLVAVHHRLQSSCLELTPTALHAGPHRAVFGTWTYTWTWYWQPLLALLLALCGLAWLLWRRVRRAKVDRSRRGLERRVNSESD